jgi:hypothetical protein
MENKSREEQQKPESLLDAIAGVSCLGWEQPVTD